MEDKFIKDIDAKIEKAKKAENISSKLLSVFIGLFVTCTMGALICLALSHIASIALGVGTLASLVGSGISATVYTGAKAKFDDCKNQRSKYLKLEYKTLSNASTAEKSSTKVSSTKQYYYKPEKVGVEENTNQIGL